MNYLIEMINVLFKENKIGIFFNRNPYHNYFFLLRINLIFNKLDLEIQGIVIIF